MLRAMLRGIFRTKNLDDILASAQEKGHTLKRTIGPINITLLGIGAIIGAGIFATVGTAAAGDAARPGAGPSLMLSFGITAVVCAFTALCYAEMAAMVPISGSAYTYSYATLGELVAWIIGWDLILEYAVGNMAVAVGWSGYFVRLFGSLFGLKFPVWAVNDYGTAKTIVAQGGEALSNFSSATIPTIAGYPIALNLPALLVVAAVTALLIYGIRESARTNNTIVIIKLTVVVFVISFGAFMIHPT